MTTNDAKNYLDFCSFGFVVGSISALRASSLSMLLLGALCLLSLRLVCRFWVSRQGRNRHQSQRNLRARVQGLSVHAAECDSVQLGANPDRLALVSNSSRIASRFAVMLLGFAVSWLWVWCYSSFLVRLELPKECLNRDLFVEAEVADFPREMRRLGSDPFVQLSLRLRQIDLPVCRDIESARVYYSGDEILNLGDILTGTLELKPIRGFSNFSEDAQVAHAIGTQQLARGRLTEISSLRGSESHIAQARILLAERIDAQQTLEPTEKGVLKALVLGFKDDIPDDLRSTFSDLGIGHLLVISGLHVGFLGGVLILLLRWTLRPLCLWFPLSLNQGLIAFCAFVFVLYYAGLAGGSLPVIRATAAFGGWLLAGLIGRGGQPIRLFWWIVCIALAFNPFTSLLPSFWLSFGAVFVVLCAGVAVRRFPMRVRPVLTHTIVCLSVAPIGALYFQQMPLFSIPANLIAIPVVSFWVVPAALGASALELLVGSSWAAPLWRFASAPIGFSDRLGADASFGIQHTSGALVAALASLALLALWMPISWRWRCVCAGCLVIYWVPLNPLFKSDTATLTVFDVGQGSSALFETKGKRLLFDLAGGLPETFHVYDQTVAPFLLEQGVSKVSHVVVTHNDFDHSGGWFSQQFGLAYDHLVSAGGFLQESEPCTPGRVESWSSEVQLLWLSGFEASAGLSDNDSSCVLQIRAFGHTILLVGDLGKDHERALVRYWRERLKSDVLLVSHHGSNTSTSSTWLKWVQPSIALVSAGFNNHFGHPSRAVLKRLAEAGVCVLNTADTGAIRLTWSRTKPIRTATSRQTVRRFWQHNAEPPCT